MNEFAYYLDAWKYCRDHDIPLASIQRKDWKTWIVCLDKTIKQWIHKVGNE